jgi:hypothetical protein
VCGYIYSFLGFLGQTYLVYFYCLWEGFSFIIWILFGCEGISEPNNLYNRKLVWMGMMRKQITHIEQTSTLYKMDACSI